MNNSCRLCLRVKENMIPIFQNERSLQSLITTCCSIEVLEDDLFPKSICEQCNESLQAIHIFRVQCKESNEILNRMCKPSVMIKISDVSLENLVQHETNTLEVNNSTENDNSRLNIDLIPTDAINGLSKSSQDQEDESCLQKSNISNKPNLRIKILNGRIEEINQTNGKDDFKHIPVETERKTKEEVVDEDSEESSKFSCKKCDKAFSNKKDYVKHRRRGHIQDGDFKCDTCQAPFTKKFKLQLHMRVHEIPQPKIENKPYSCKQCIKTFVSRNGLRTHIKISHEGHETFSCSFCDRTFSLLSYKKRHEMTHSKEKRYACHLCDSAFSSANGLKNHVGGHIGEMRYKCEVCDKPFRRQQYVKQHMTKHTGETPYECKICGSKYRNSGSLFLHMKKCKAANQV